MLARRRTTRSCSSPSGWTKLAGAIGAAVAAFDRAGWFGAANEYTFDHACLRFLAGDAKSYRRLVARMAADDGRTTDAARCLVSPALARWPPALLPPRPTWCMGRAGRTRRSLALGPARPGPDLPPCRPAARRNPTAGEIGGCPPSWDRSPTGCRWPQPTALSTMITEAR